MSAVLKLYEDCLGSDESPWASDTDGNTIQTDASFGSTTTAIVAADDLLTVVNTTNPSRTRSVASTPASFTDGTVRAQMKSSMVGSSWNTHGLLLLRVGAPGSNAGLECGFGSDSVGGDRIDIRNSDGVYIGPQQPIGALVADAFYNTVFTMDGTTGKAMIYALGAFPPHSDYMTPTWNHVVTNAGFSAAAGKAGVGVQRVQSNLPSWKFTKMVAHEKGTVCDVCVVGLTVGNGLLTIGITDAAVREKAITLWSFLIIKDGSAPTGPTDGTVVVPATPSNGLGGNAIRSDGGFLDAPASFNLTGLINGHTYHVRPYAVMDDGSIIPGTSVSMAPVGGDTTAPLPPPNFVVVDKPTFTAGQADANWTNPAEAGELLLNVRTDGIDPTGPTDGSASIIQNWVAYTANSAGTKALSSLPLGLRHRYALWHRDAALNVSTGARCQWVPISLITVEDPASGALGVQVNPLVRWPTAAGQAENGLPVHYVVEASTVGGTDAAFLAARIIRVSSLEDGAAGFEYEVTTGVWATLPTSGLPSAAVGSRVRYRLSLTQSGQYYVRISTQQPSS